MLDYWNTFTARAMTMPRMASEMSDGRAIQIFAHGTSGITYVGLKAVAFVKPRRSRARVAPTSGG